MSKKKKYEKIVIGRLDRIDIPFLELYNLEAKIDTGAYSCSLHCTNIGKIEEEGREMVAFNLLDPEHPQYQEKKFCVKDFTETEVKSSSGEKERRFVVNLTIRLFGRSFKTDFTLTNRADMKFPALLGRKLLQHGFVVDVNKKNLSYKYKKKNKL